MEVKSKLKNVPTSPRKMRLLADAIRGQEVFQALNMLKHDNRETSRRLEKLVLCGINNWEQSNKVNPADHDLYIKTISVDSGRVLKRFRPAPQGRAHRIRKRSNHVNIVIDSRVPIENASDGGSDDVNDEQE